MSPLMVVTPSLAYGNCKSRLFSASANPRDAVQIIRAGGRALVADADTALEAAQMLGMSQNKASLLVRNALPVDEDETLTDSAIVDLADAPEAV